MMIKYRVSEVAKDFGKTTKEVVGILAEFDDAPKKKHDRSGGKRTGSGVRTPPGESGGKFRRIFRRRQGSERGRKEKEAEKAAAEEKGAAKAPGNTAAQPAAQRRARSCKGRPAKETPLPEKARRECSCGRRSRAKQPGQPPRSAGGTADGRYPHPAGQCGK